ncbi:MAG: hypothetical protein NC127_07950 [Muribaculum sp.]|nr:hypothetical protein [Muribaculum sp.]
MDVVFNYQPPMPVKSMEEENELRRLAREYFNEKSYSDKVLTYVILWQSIPADSMFVLKPFPPQYTNRDLQPLEKYKDFVKPLKIEKQLMIDVEVPYSEYSAQDTKIGRWNVIGKAILAYLREMKYPVVLRKKFDRDRFNADMEAFFRSLGCSLE